MDMPSKFAAVLVGVGLAVGGGSIAAEAWSQAHADPYGGCIEAMQPGNPVPRECRPGPRWFRVTPELADVLAESGLPHADTRRWERCVVHVGDTDRIFCPNGFTAGIS